MWPQSQRSFEQSLLNDKIAKLITGMSPVPPEFQEVLNLWYWKLIYEPPK
jgi:hypothetical protein